MKNQIWRLNLYENLDMIYSQLVFSTYTAVDLLKFTLIFFIVVLLK